MKILVVDDDKEIVQLLEIYVKNEGYEPVAAYNGKEALTKLNTTPDLGLDDAGDGRDGSNQAITQGFGHSGVDLIS